MLPSCPILPANARMHRPPRRPPACPAHPAPAASSSIQRRPPAPASSSQRRACPGGCGTRPNQRIAPPAPAAAAVASNPGRAGDTPGRSLAARCSLLVASARRQPPTGTQRPLSSHAGEGPAPSGAALLLLLLLPPAAGQSSHRRAPQRGAHEPRPSAVTGRRHAQAGVENKPRLAPARRLKGPPSPARASVLVEPAKPARAYDVSYTSRTGAFDSFAAPQPEP